MDERNEVSSAVSDDEKSLRDKIDRFEAELDGLERDLTVADRELERLGEKKHQFEVLDKICGSLEELDSLGAQHLFWGKQGDADEQSDHIDTARKNIEAFADEVKRAEEHRESIIDQIMDHNQVLDFLDYDLRDAMERAESLRAEWEIEREADELPYRAQIMPWTRGCDEDLLSRRSVAASVLWCILLGLLIPLVDLPMPELSQLIEVPERVAKLIREETPPPPVEVEEPPPPEEVEPEPVLAEEPADEFVEPIEEPVVAEVAQPATREQVKSKGILAFRESFASRAMSRPSAQLGSQARVRNAGQNAVGRPERSMVTTLAPGSSGGINLAELSRETGAGGLQGRSTSRVSSDLADSVAANAQRRVGGSGKASRTDEEIQIVFDRNKSALYRLYNRELRKDPTLRGQLVLRLTIEPDGTVSLCQLQSSDMDAPSLAQQVVDRVRGFDFGAKEGIIAMTIIYPIDFLPAA